MLERFGDRIDRFTNWYMSIRRPERYAGTFIAPFAAAVALDYMVDLAVDNLSVHNFEHITVEGAIGTVVLGAVGYMIGKAKDNQEL